MTALPSAVIEGGPSNFSLGAEAATFEGTVAVNVSIHALERFRGRVSHGLPNSDERVREIIQSSVLAAIEQGRSSWWFDTKASGQQTLAAELDGEYRDLVALLRMTVPSMVTHHHEAVDHSLTVVTFLTRSMAHDCIKSKVWVKDLGERPLLGSEYFGGQAVIGGSATEGKVCLTYLLHGKHRHEFLHPDELGNRVKVLILSGADPNSFARWSRDETEIEVTLKVGV